MTYRIDSIKITYERIFICYFNSYRMKAFCAFKYR
nr:MAG TPA: hypothetical protein [Caudoviricetes sp.]